MSKKVLGRGLNTLIPNRIAATPPLETPTQEPTQPPAPNAPVTHVALDQLTPNPFQPRRRFDDAQLEELAQSIRSDGIIQPIVARKVGNNYEIIAGERRWRAAKLAGLAKVPVHLQQVPDTRMLEVALIENIQRADLNPIETAQAFQAMNRELGLNHEEIGKRTGKDRVTITNTIRLLQLPEDLQQLVIEGKLSPGHGRAILKVISVEGQRSLAKEALHKQWTVRQTEQRISPPWGTRPPAEKRDIAGESALGDDPNIRAAVEELERALGTKVRLVEKPRGKGHLEIEYYSAEDLDRIYSAIVRDSA